MAKLRSLRITNYRSIAESVDIVFPQDAPLVLLGENNAGKSNIIKALQLIFGPVYPSNYQPEDNEFFGRDPENTIEIVGRFDHGDLFGERYSTVTWRYDAGGEPPVSYKGAPGAYGNISNKDRDTCTCIVIEADRHLRYQLSYSSKWTFLSRLMHKFHRSLDAYPAIRAELQAAFDSIKGSFKKVPEFQSFSEQLQDHFTQLVGSMTHRLDIDFEAYNPANFFHALELHASEGGTPRALEEMGTGEQQVLAMAFAHAFAKAFHGGIILVVEEPESHLHPLAQKWLAQQLAEMCSDHLQIVVTTHSASFVDVMNLEGLVLVRKHAGRSTAIQKTIPELVAHCVASGASSTSVTSANVLPFYAANATPGIMEGFFGKAAVLVEGPTEALSLPTYLSNVGLETAKEGISVIGVQGKGNLAKWRRLFTCYDIPCYVIFDNDSGDDGAGGKRRDALASVGIGEADQDQYIATTDWLIEDRVAVFGTDFEKVLRSRFPEYASLEAAAASLGVDSKPFVARFVAEHLTIDGSDGWGKVKTLAERVRSLLTVEGKPATPAAPVGEPNDLDDDEIPF